MWFRFCITDTEHLCVLSSPKALCSPKDSKVFTVFVIFTADVDLKLMYTIVYMLFPSRIVFDVFFFLCVFTKIKIMPQHEYNSSNIGNWPSAMALE